MGLDDLISLIFVVCLVGILVASVGWWRGDLAHTKISNPAARGGVAGVLHYSAATTRPTLQLVAAHVLTDARCESPRPLAFVW
jgi:hypothetical protein